MKMGNEKRIDANLSVMHAIHFYNPKERVILIIFWLHLTSNGNGKFKWKLLKEMENTCA